MPEKPKKSGSSAGMEDNLKKSVTEMLVLLLLRERAMYAGEISSELSARSGGLCSIVFPYSALYRMLDFGYLCEQTPKRIAPDGRRRQYYGITAAGETHLESLLTCYRRFTGGVDAVLRSTGHRAGNQEGTP